MMKKSTVASLFIATLLITMIGNVAIAQESNDYEKWGRIAVEVAKESYGADVEFRDYTYVGREELSEKEAKDTFKLVASNGQDKFEVVVTLVFDKKTKLLKQLSLEEKR